jgi:hypothetical protein
MVSVARDALSTRLQGDKLRSTPIQPTASHLKTLAQLDVSTLGISREKHHPYLLNDCCRARHANYICDGAAASARPRRIDRSCVGEQLACDFFG